jgi:hypothetical protein
MADPDDTDRVLVVVLPATAHSPGELVRVGLQMWRALDDGADEHLRAHKSEIIVAWAMGDEHLRELIAEAVINDEWLSVLRRNVTDVRAIAVGPLHLEHSPILAAAVAESKEFGRG